MDRNSDRAGDITLKLRYGVWRLSLKRGNFEIVAQLFHVSPSERHGGSLLLGATLVARKSRFLSKISSSFYLCAVLIGLSSIAGAQVSTFAGNEHHTNEYSVGGQILNKVKWQTTIDNSANGGDAHYCQPLITPNNTVITAVLSGSMGSPTVSIQGINGSTGATMYTLPTDYTWPSFDWLPSYQPAITNGPNGERLYYQGNGGTIWYVDGIDTSTPSAPTQLAFYGLSNYTSNAANFNSSVFIDTPITIDSNGNIFFGFRVQGTAPLPINSTKSGWARIDSSGNGSYVLVDAMTGDSSMNDDSHNCAPALSNDESTVYVVAKTSANGLSGYVVGLDSTTLSTKYKVAVYDPRPNPASPWIADDSTASPMVGPDGDVYFGILLWGPSSGQFNGSRGALLHFSSDLSVTKTPGQFGWDFTPGIVPASMVPSYHGTSSYLLFCKYNNYEDSGSDGDQINRVAIIDPNDQTQTEWHVDAVGETTMREVMTVLGCTPDSEAGLQLIPDNTREWCVNATAVDLTNDCVFFNSEDGNTYRWNLAQNSLVQVCNMASAFGAPYVAQSIGPDGTVYTFNDIWMFAEGQDPNVGVTLDSSSPDDGTFVSGSTVSFTATVTGSGPTPTGNVTFTDLVYGAWNNTNGDFDTYPATLGTAPLVNGVATLSNVTLTSDTTTPLRPSHFITAEYDGDSNYTGTFKVTRIQKVHPFGSTTAVVPTTDPTPAGQPVQLTATVASVPGGSGTPTGYVYFHVGAKALGQTYLDNTGTASLTTSAIPAGTQTVSADYVSDTNYAASTGTVPVHILGIGSVTATPLKFRSGTTSTGTVNISANVTSTATVNLSSNNAALTVPSSVNVNSGSSSANFVINGTNSTYLDITGTVTASWSGTQAQRSLIVQPDNRSTFISQSVPSQMTPSQTYPVSLVFKNAGTIAWDTAHGYELYSENPANNSSFGLNRIPLTSGTVSPGSNGTFSATVTAPSTPGTYNFQWICFENSDNMQFGPTSTNVAVNVSAATDNSQFISETSIPTSVGPSFNFTAQLTFKNTGTTTWNALNYSLLSVGSNDFGVASIACPSTAPGATSNFPAGGPQTFTAPASPGSYTFQYQLANGSTGFGQKSTSVTIVVAAADAAHYISNTVATTMNAGTDFTASFTMENTGITTWSTASGYNLMSINPNNNTTWGQSHLILSGSTSVSPGQQAALTAPCTAPIMPGSYMMQWQMNKSGTVFGETTPSLNINVVQGPDDAQWVSTSSLPSTVGAGTTFSATITMKNLGTATWSSAYALLAVPTSNWGVPSIAAATVAPNANGTFTATFTAPSSPGAYSFRWRMSHSGTKFGQASPAATITVGTDNSQYVTSTVPTTANAGNDFSVSYTMKNTGTSTWTTAAYSMLTLDALNNTTWGTNRMALTSSVAPGAQFVFTKTVTAPVTPGNYAMEWQMNNNGTVFGQTTPITTITVSQGADDATYVSQTVQTTVAHGATFSVTVNMKNTGTATWSGPTYSLLVLGTGVWGPAISSPSVAPNATGAFTEMVTAPATPGTYTFVCRMQHGSTRFGQASALVNITVT